MLLNCRVPYTIKCALFKESTLQMEEALYGQGKHAYGGYYGGSADVDRWEDPWDWMPMKNWPIGDLASSEMRD